MRAEDDCMGDMRGGCAAAKPVLKCTRSWRCQWLAVAVPLVPALHFACTHRRVRRGHGIVRHESRLASLIRTL